MTIKPYKKLLLFLGMGMAVINTACTNSTHTDNTQATTKDININDPTEPDTTEADINDIDYSTLTIHGDRIIQEIGTRGNMYYYAYFTDDSKSSYQICSYDIVRNKMQEINVFCSDDVAGEYIEDIEIAEIDDNIKVFENGLEIFTTITANKKNYINLYLIDSSGKCLYSGEKSKFFTNITNPNIFFIDDDYIYCGYIYQVIRKEIKTGKEDVFIDLSEEKITIGKNCYKKGNYLVMEATITDENNPAVVIYDNNTGEINVINNRFLAGSSDNNKYLLLKEEALLNQTDFPYVYIYSLEENTEKKLDLANGDESRNSFISDDGSRIFTYYMPNDGSYTASVYSYDIATGAKTTIYDLSPCYGIWATTSYGRTAYFLTGQEEGYVLERHKY